MGYHMEAMISLVLDGREVNGILTPKPRGFDSVPHLHLSLTMHSFQEEDTVVKNLIRGRQVGFAHAALFSSQC